MKNRSANVDLARFIAIVLIMAHHIYTVGLEDYPFHEAWIYVEFFLLVTGYYTAKHYSGMSAGNRSKDAFQYTIKKFLPLLPYVIIVSFCGWISKGFAGLLLEGWSWKDFCANFMGDFIFDLLLISDSFTIPLVAPLWYISAMMIVFPFFCLLVQVKNRYSKVLVSIITPLMYYGWIGVSGYRAFPHDMLRVFVGMMLGLVIFEFSEIFDSYIESMPKVILTCLEFVTFLYPIICCYGNYAEKGYTTTRLYLLCFFIFLLLCLPGFSHSVAIKGIFFNYLGKLSMVIFIIHFYIGLGINTIGNYLEWNSIQRVVFYYMITIIASTLLMLIIDSCTRWNKFVNKRIELID